MCLAKVYIEPPLANDRSEDPPTLVMENVARAAVDGDVIRITSLFGESQELHGSIRSMDFVEGKVFVTP